MTVQMQAIKQRETYHEIESLKPQIVDGIRLCLNCEKPIPEGNEKYCTRQCCVEFFAKNGSFSDIDMRIKMLDVFKVRFGEHDAFELGVMDKLKIILQSLNRHPISEGKPE